MDIVDVDGLCTLPTPEERERYAIALGLNRENFIRRTGLTISLSTLSQLSISRGVHVYTGPTACKFFSLVSSEVFVHVVPDNYIYTYRTKDIETWSLFTVGFTETEIKLLKAHPPTTRSKMYAKYQEALSLQEQYKLIPEQQPITPPTTRDNSLHIITDPIEQWKFLDSIQSTVALDFEWTIPDERLIGVNLSMFDTDDDYYLPVLAQDFDQSKTAPILLNKVFSLVRRVTTIWHNGKADFKSQYPGDPLDLTDCDIHDTILMAYVAGEQSLGLKDITARHLGTTPVKLPAHLETLSVSEAGRYGASGDTRNTVRLFNLFKFKLEETDQWSIYNDIERPLVPVLASMERYGIPLDLEEVQRLRDKFFAQEEAIRDTIINTHGLDFSNDAQQREYVNRNGFHAATLDKRVLSKLNADWVTPLLEYRDLRTLRRNFLDKHLDNGEQILFPSFNQSGRDTDSGSWINAPATGRLSSSGPNLQNQPRAIRSCFVAPQGYKLVSLDYSALELRLAAAISGDEVMLSVLKSGGDLHQYMREVIERETGVDVGRPTAKTANFNLRYGGQADMLVTIAAKQGAHLTYDTAKTIVEIDHATYTGYWNWFDRTISLAKREGYSATLFGRRRYNENLVSSDSMKRGHAERAAANMVIQGTGADIIKTAMRQLIPVLKYYKAHLALQVHDELVFWVPEDVVDRFLIAAKGIMESVPIPHLKLIVEGGHGHNWAEVH